MRRLLVSAIILLVCGTLLSLFGVYEYSYETQYKELCLALEAQQPLAAADCLTALKSSPLRNNLALGMAEGILQGQDGNEAAALNSFLAVAQRAKEKGAVSEYADALYNASVILMKQASGPQEEEALKTILNLLSNALRANPMHWRAKWNYELLMHRLMQKQGGGSGVGNDAATQDKSPSHDIPEPRL